MFTGTPIRYAAFAPDWRGRVADGLLWRRMVPDRQAAQAFVESLQRQLQRGGIEAERATRLIESLQGWQGS
jgi:hypothetical protein